MPWRAGNYAIFAKLDGMSFALRGTVLVSALWFATGCGAKAPPASKVVSPSAPTKDDGATAKGAGVAASDEHAATLEQLKVAPPILRVDKQKSLRIPLPDGKNWTRVKFFGVESLVGFRYGKDHHAVLGAFVTHVDDNQANNACPKSFEKWAAPWVDAFDVTVRHEAPLAVTWRPLPSSNEVPQIVDIDSVFAETATLVDHDSYAGAYATYPVWSNACLIVGMAVPARGESSRAKEVRDRFVKEVFPKVEVLVAQEPKERY